MADKKITQLTQVTELTGAELLPLAQGGVTKSASVDQLRGYKVYTALLTQSGGSSFANLTSGDLTIGVTYLIQLLEGADFSNVGGNNVEGDYFVATGTTPNSWGTGGQLEYNTGAPVVTVLENTIGNIWFTYNSVGDYGLNSDGLFTIGKTTAMIGSAAEGVINGALSSIVFSGSNSAFNISTAVIIAGAATSFDDELSNTPVEIRVYN